MEALLPPVAVAFSTVAVAAQGFFSSVEKRNEFDAGGIAASCDNIDSVIDSVNGSGGFTGGGGCSTKKPEGGDGGGGGSGSTGL